MRAILCDAALTLTLTLAAASAMGGTPAAAPPDPHAHHRQDATRDLQRISSAYALPNVTLTRADGLGVRVPAVFDDGRPVLLNFVYTSCTTICPLSSQVFSQFQEALGAKERARVHLVSISIDPEQDTPARLREYAAQFHAQRGWDHYTGSVEAVAAVRRAFNAYRGDKMSHTPLTYLREAPGKPWVRLDGFATTEDLRSETQGWGSLLVSR